MQAPMTKARALTLITGVVALFLFSWWRLAKAPEENAAPPTGNATLSSKVSSAAEIAPSSKLVSFAGNTMGTTYSVKLFSDRKGIQPLATSAVSIALAAVNGVMSTYNPKSELSLFNAAPQATPTRLSSPLFEVLLLSHRLSAQTKGAFDITIRPLVRAYGFGSDARKTPPSERELVQLRQLVGMDQLQLNAMDISAQKMKDGVELDLSGIAKGYGVDQAALALKKLGIKNYLVEVGGEIRYLGGKIDDKGQTSAWTLAIEKPDPAARKLHGILKAAPSGGALATSGDYRNFRQVGDVVTSHTFDPRSGRPSPRRTASVSILRPTAAEADGLATALGVLEPTEAIELADKMNWSVYLLVHKKEGGFRALSSEAFRKLPFKRVDTD